MSSGTSGALARTSVFGAIVNRRSIRAASSAVPSGSASASGSSSGGPDRPPDPEPGDRGVAPGLLGVVREEPGRPRLGDIGGDLGVVGGDAGPDGRVGLGRVGEVGERDRPADDRHGVARAPGAPRDSAAVRRRDHRRTSPDRAASLRRPRRPCPAGPDRQQRRDGRIPIELGRGDALPVAERQPGRLLAQHPGPIVEADRRVPARDRAGTPACRPISSTTRNPTARSSDRSSQVAGVVVAALDRRAVVDARRALERRDQQSPPPARSGRSRGPHRPRASRSATCRCRRCVPPCDSRPSRGRAATGPRRPRRRAGSPRAASSDPSIHASYRTGRAGFSRSGVRGGSTGPAATRPGPPTRSATTVRSRTRGSPRGRRTAPPMTMSTRPAAIGPRPLTSSPPVG